MKFILLLFFYSADFSKISERDRNLSRHSFNAYGFTDCCFKISNPSVNCFQTDMISVSGVFYRYGKAVSESANVFQGNPFQRLRNGRMQFKRAEAARHKTKHSLGNHSDKSALSADKCL